ncbi:hypothetical protein POSPLADRAFT_1057117 [Postia placenta MAD-698-R-SB12]|uniref:Uncharacterized protein n=1 Tax=Postia placenta MAD-698-R-SB12 TaxID=670580 RepID=A0A1X6MYA9_9APHY|nr:hypothetical protein POSPLADRAFT_1057117 [Postia placenta MAD-698-R-SB12]OSX61358.1 hypothetical protein POSPLADRAFT_1057117 [Postia placenta MAD-698-R-SB12]
MPKDVSSTVRYQQLFRAESREQRRYHPYKQRQRACYNWEDDAVSTTTATWLRVPEPDVDEEKEVSPVDKPDARFEPTENLATAPDGNLLIQADTYVIAQAVELPPDPDKSIDVQFDVKSLEVRNVGWNSDLVQLPPTRRERPLE